MGSPPPPDFPTPEQQAAAGVEATFEPSPTGAALCGFGVPSFTLSVSIPGFDLPIGLPNLSLALAINCDLEDPLDADLSFGGGRVPAADPDPDDDP